MQSMDASGNATVDAGAEFDVDVARWLRDRASDPTAADLSTEGARRHSRAVSARARALRNGAPTAASETEIQIDTPNGLIGARVYRPLGSGPFDTVVYFHGGGWVLGDLDTHGQHAERLCVEARAVVVSVDYRLAPEHPFPGAFDDSLAATQWAGEHLSELGGDTRLVVAGDSAGAQLAASVALACRHGGPALSAQLLIVPVTDLRGGYEDAESNAAYPSRTENAAGYGLTIDGMANFTRLYGVDPARPDWRSSPLCAEDVTGAPPAVMHLCGFDPLRDEGIAYATRLRAAGVPVLLRTWPTLNHGYFGLGGVSIVVDQAVAQASRDLLTHLADESRDRVT
jgi:acetyl esterase